MRPKETEMASDNHPSGIFMPDDDERLDTPRGVDRAMATALAERIHSSLVDAMLTWGEAVNDAEAHPGDSLKKTIAQQAGLEACRLAAGVAAKLRPGRK